MEPTSEHHRAVSRREAMRWLGTAGLVTVAAACGSSAGTSAATKGATTTTGAAGHGAALSTSTTAPPAPTTTAGPATAPTATTGQVTTATTAKATTAPVAATTTTAAATTSCVLTPEETEGPYYIAGEAIRTDITEGKTGLPLRLAFVVLNVNRCAAIANASVDIWHADTGGNYSGFNTAASNRTFLRGIQVSDAGGAAGFHTIYPGWYQGRATHIHVKVHVGGTVVHTGQLFFDEAINQAVYGTPAYSSHTGSRTLNSQDSIYAGAGAQSLLRLTPEGSGFLGSITLGVKA